MSQNLSELRRIQFLQRLKQLQNLCSSGNSNYPDALLFVVGADGRNNKGGYMILKYLFQCSVGKELYEGGLDEKFDALEDIVLLVQENSISILLNVESRAILAPYLALCPFVVEYNAPNGNTEEIDIFQARKAADFKRMMIESVPAGGVIGIPVPLGYDNVQDIENWALLRSFAMEQIVHSTGFFSARYTVIDISEILDMLFRSVDSFTVTKAIDVLQNSVVPNIQQCLHSICGRGSNDSRLRLTAEDIVSPLELLFEFGELETVFPVDPKSRPIVLLGSFTNAIGVISAVSNNTPWKRATTSASCLNAVVELLEPSTGLRCCRTYFLQRGKLVGNIADPESLVNSEVSVDEATIHNQRFIASDISRLEFLYVTITEALRSAALHVFGGITGRQTVADKLLSRDILSVGEEIEAYVRRWVLEKAQLLDGEILRFHMDCMNGLGQPCKIEEIEDIGGQCWTYFRLSIHGIKVSVAPQPVGVAIGDTFLFSPNFVQIKSLSESELKFDDKLDLLDGRTLYQDPFCITHAIPYVFCTFGSGAEEAAAQKLLHSARSTHLLSFMGLGAAIEAHGSSSSYTFPLLTDSRSNPYFENAQLTLYEGGFVFEKLNGALLPGVVNFENHITEMWTIDLSDFLQVVESVCCQTKRFISDSLPSIIPDGMLLLFRLKDYANSADVSLNCLQENPFCSFLIDGASVKFIALIVRSDNVSSSGYYSRALPKWKRSIRTFDVSDNRGIVASAVPITIARSFLALCDKWSISKTDGYLLNESEVDILSVTRCPLVYPGGGYVLMMHTFVMCENLRLYIAELDMLKSIITSTDQGSINSDFSSKADEGIASGDVMILLGHSGSCVTQIATSILSRFPQDADIAQVVFDCSEHDNLPIHVLTSLISTRLNDSLKANISGVSKKILLVLSIIPSLVPDLELFLESCLPPAVSIRFVVSVIAGVFLNPLKSVNRNSEENVEAYFQNNRFGIEVYEASIKALCRPKFCDGVLCIDGSFDGSNTTTVRTIARAGSISIELPVYRVRPATMWLEEDFMTALISKFWNCSTAKITKFANATHFTNIFISHPFHSIADRETRSGDDASTKVFSRLKLSYAKLRSEISDNGLISLTTWKTAASAFDIQLTDVPDIEMVVSCLKAFFPHASCPTTTFSADVWSLPSLKPGQKVGTMSRAFQLATAKVVKMKMFEINRSRLGKQLKPLVETEAFKSCSRGLFSVSGFIYLPSGSSLASSEAIGVKNVSSKVVLIDACRDYISVRFAESFNPQTNPNKSDLSRLCITGILSSRDHNLVDELFSSCYLLKLEPKRLITFADLSQADLSHIQEQNSHVPPPNGFWWDGNAFVDIHGSRKTIRPDIKLLATEYIRVKNTEVDRYNSFLDAV